MRSPRKTALKAASGLATVYCMMHTGRAYAADDPFALPAMQQAGQSDQLSKSGMALDAATKPAGAYILFADVSVNGHKIKRIAKLQDRDGQLAIAAESALYAGLIDKVPQTDFIPLKDIAGISFSFDWVGYRLDISKLRQSDGPNLIDFGTKSSSANDVAKPLTALMIDYDLSASVNRRGTSAAGLVSARLVRGNVAAQGNWRVQTNPASGQSRAIRLDTALTINHSGKMARATIGDFVSSTPNSSRAVRMGGLQLATDFALRPDLITYPLPDYSGNVAVPSGLDLFVNDRRLSAAAIESGEFTVRSIPVPVGRSEIGVVVRDSLGREQLQSVSFYSSRALLAPGLVQASVNIGAIRQNYGRYSDDYGHVVASMMYRRGFNRHFTGEAALEWSENFLNAGGGGRFAVGSLGLLSGDFRLSRFKPRIGPYRRGRMLAASFESVGPIISVQLEAQQVSNGYDDLASANGDAPPKSLFAANINFDLKSLGTMRFAVVRQRRQRGIFDDDKGRTTRVVSASYRKSFGDGFNFFADLSHRSGAGEPAATTALLGISLQFGGRTHIQGSASFQGNRDQTELGLFRPDSVPGDLGYAIQAGVGVVERLNGLVSYRGDWGRIQAQGENVEGESAARVSARGSLILADNHLFASDRVNGGFVVVDAGGIEGVTIQRENRPAGKTPKSGKFLVTEITPYVPTKLGIDPKSLPHDAMARKLSDMIVVAPRSASKLDLGISRYVPSRFRLNDLYGTAFAPGTMVRALPSNSEYLIGYDGIVEINHALEDSELRIEQPDGNVCHADLQMIETSYRGEMRILSCYARIRTMQMSRSGY